VGKKEKKKTLQMNLQSKNKCSITANVGCWCRVGLESTRYRATITLVESRDFEQPIKPTCTIQRVSGRFLLEH